MQRFGIDSQPSVEEQFLASIAEFFGGDRDQAKDFLCNSIEINDTIITPSDMFSLSFSGRKTLVCDMSEFMKSGGAVKCLTLKL